MEITIDNTLKMNTKILIILISLFLVSCTGGLGENILGTDYPGFQISVWTNEEVYKEFEGELFIGGVKDSMFVPTESIYLHFDGGFKNRDIAFYYNEDNNKVFYKKENSWKPDIEAIQNIPSEKYCFLLKLPDGRQEVIKWSGGVETAFRMDTKYGLPDDFSLDIGILKDRIAASGYIENGLRDTLRILKENSVYEP